MSFFGRREMSSLNYILLLLSFAVAPASAYVIAVIFQNDITRAFFQWTSCVCAVGSWLSIVIAFGYWLAKHLG